MDSGGVIKACDVGAENIQHSVYFHLKRIRAADAAKTQTEKCSQRVPAGKMTPGSGAEKVTEGETEPECRSASGGSERAVADLAEGDG